MDQAKGDAKVSTLTDTQRKLLQHTLGARPDQNKKNYGYRNGYLASVGSTPHQEFKKMVDLGFAVAGESEDGMQYFHATVEGCKAIGLGKAAIKRAFEE